MAAYYVQEAVILRRARQRSPHGAKQARSYTRTESVVDHRDPSPREDGGTHPRRDTSPRPRTRCAIATLPGSPLKTATTRSQAPAFVTEIGHPRSTHGSSSGSDKDALNVWLIETKVRALTYQNSFSERPMRSDVEQVVRASPEKDARLTCLLEAGTDPHRLRRP